MNDISNMTLNSITLSARDGLVGEPRAVAYCASKGGVLMLTNAMALDYAKDGIRVNCICPGYVMTSMIEQDLPKDMQKEKYFESLLQEHPMERIGKPEEGDCKSSIVPCLR